MATLNEFAKDYVPKATTKNIAELPEVSTDVEIEDDEFEFTKDGKTKVVQQKIIEINGEKYRVPISVIKQLKILLEDNPNIKRFKVKKSGTTKDDTSYMVIPLV